MASILKFTDGTTTVTFDGTTDGKIVTYNVLTPEVRTLTVSKITRDGEEMIAQSYRDVVEEIELYISGTWSQITTKIRLLNRLWERVRRYQDMPIESPVFICLKPDGDADYWRSPLKSVSTDLEPSALDMFLGQGKLIFTLTITREFYWEAESEVELQLYNLGAGQSKGIGGKTIYNSRDTDGGGVVRCNYVDIDNTDLVGDLPARLRVKMTNKYNNADRNYKVYMGLSFRTDIANFTHIIEGESCPQGSQLPGSPDYTTYSSGYYRNLSWTGVNEVLLGRWDLTTANLNAAKSNYFMLYAKIWATYTDVYLRPKITAVGGLTTLWAGPQFLIRSGYDLVCFGPIQIPPTRQIGSTPYPENLDLTVQCPSGSSSVAIDWLMLSPMDRWRQLIFNGYGFDYDSWLMDDGINERLYTDGWATAGHLYNFVGYGPWLEVTPVPEASGKHRIIFCWTGLSTARPPRTMIIQIWYRPRRKQL